MRHMAWFSIALVAALTALVPRTALASSWGSGYGDPWGFCPAESFLPSTYTAIVTNDPSVPNNPEQSTFWGIHTEPGWDDWYGYWYGDFAGKPGDDSGWHLIARVPLGQVAHWNFGNFGWQVHGHAKQYIAYWNWSFNGGCGWWNDGSSPPPFMADVYGYPVVDIYVDSVPPNPPVPRAIAVTTSSITFTWDPVTDRADGAGADAYAVGMGTYDSWITVNGAPQQRAITSAPRQLTVIGLGQGQTACVHVIAADRLGNATADQQKCAQVIAPPPMPAPPAAGVVGYNPSPAGLTGLESWFWLTPAPAIVASTTVGAGAYQYVVTQVPAAVSWTFGDGSTVQLAVPDGAGAAYPTRSPVNHVYERFSTAGYPVAATVTWSVQWLVTAGGVTYGPYALGTQQSSAPGVAYPVRQAQAELTG
jgi:hypothetical protein